MAMAERCRNHRLLTEWVPFGRYAIRTTHLSGLAVRSHRRLEPSTSRFDTQLARSFSCALNCDNLPTKSARTLCSDPLRAFVSDQHCYEPHPFRHVSVSPGCLRLVYAGRSSYDTSL